MAEESRMIIQHNIEAMNSMNCFGRVNKKLSKSTEKLSSGYRINRAADDAAGLTISEKMRWQVRGLNRAARNIKDGVSYCNVAEGALGEIHSMLGRMKELSVQAANDTNTDADRAALNDETQQLKKEIDKIFEDTMFNTQKIWCADYIPSADGTPKDFALYNTSDDKGTYIGGIEYMNHRYSWEDLGIGYDRVTQTFTKTGSVDVDGSILKDDAGTTIDDYTSRASFSIKTVAGEPLSTAQKTYSWKATDDGIAIDGIVTTGKNSKEGDTTWSALGLTKGNDVPAGTYRFNYYGMEVSFTVKEAASWTTFVDGINNQRVKLDWHSESSGFTTKESADIVKLKSSKITINNANKDKILVNGYDISANRDSLGIRYADGVRSLGWKNLTDSNGYSSITSWGTNENGSSGKSDSIGSTDDSGSSKVTIYGESHYEYDDSGIGGLIGFEFNLNETGSPDFITSDLNNSSITATTVAKTTGVIDNTASAGVPAANTSASVTSNIDFNTQRDVLNRAFSTPDETITTGSVKVDNGNTIITLNGTPDYELTYNGDVREKLSASIKDAAKKLKDSTSANVQLNDTDSLGLGKQTFSFKNGNNSINISYDLSGLTYGDVKKLASDADYNALASDIFDANSGITLKADGEAYQTLGVHNNSAKEATVKNGVMVDGFVQSLYVQTGALESQGMDIDYAYMRASNLGLAGISLETYDDSASAINQVDKAIERVSEQRSLFGAYTNRLEHAYSVNNINSENTSSAESRIRDTDMAKEMTEYSKNNILSQVGQSMLAQCNQSKNQVMQLLG